MAGFFYVCIVLLVRGARRWGLDDSSQHANIQRASILVPGSASMNALWTLDDTIARLAMPQVAGEVDVLFPWHGFAPAAARQANVALLKAFTRATDHVTPEAIVESYVRGPDLVATYAQTPERNVRPQIYWRYVESNDAPGLEVILSTQTSLLDSTPLTSMESTLPPGEVLASRGDGQWQTISEDDPAQWRDDEQAPRLLLFRPRDFGFSYAEMVHPSDFAGVQCLRQGELPTVRWQLFPERLEKGVIRRGRVRGVYLARERDTELAQAAFDEFQNSPLVLST